MALISLTPTSLRMKKEVMDDLTTLVRDLDSLDEPLGDIIHSRIIWKIDYVKKWLTSPEIGDGSRAAMEMDTLELLLEIAVQNQPRHLENRSFKDIIGKSQRIGRSVRLLNAYL